MINGGCDFCKPWQGGCDLAIYNMSVSFFFAVPLQI